MITYKLIYFYFIFPIFDFHNCHLFGGMLTIKDYLKVKFR